MKGEESIERQHRLAGRALGHRESGDRDLQGATHILASECTLAPPPALREGSGRRFKFPVRLGPSCLGLHSGVETSGSQTQLEFWPSSEGRGPQSSLPGVPVSRLCCRLPATCHLLQHPQCLAPHLWGRGCCQMPQGREAPGEPLSLEEDRPGRTVLVLHWERPREDFSDCPRTRIFPKMPRPHFTRATRTGMPGCVQ